MKPARKEFSMQKFSQKGARRRVARALGFVAGALLFGTIALSNPAAAAPGGGGHGGFGGGGFHGGLAGGGLHDGFADHSGFATGMRAGGLPAAGIRGDFAGPHDRAGVAGGGHWIHGWHDGRYGWWWGDGLGLTYYPYPGFGDYGYSQPVASQYWYCADPPGYYPYVSQCNSGWRTSPAD
jgi:hypothetical protein